MSKQYRKCGVSSISASKIHTCIKVRVAGPDPQPTGFYGSKNLNILWCWAGAGQGFFLRGGCESEILLAGRISCKIV